MNIKKSKGIHKSVALGYQIVDQSRSKFEGFSLEEIERYFNNPDNFYFDDEKKDES